MKDSKIFTFMPLIIFLIFLFILIYFTFNTNNQTNKSKDIPDDRFVKILDYRTNFVMYDKNTKIEYFVFKGGITVLYDQTGKPLIYQGE